MVELAGLMDNMLWFWPKMLWSTWTTGVKRAIQDRLWAGRGRYTSHFLLRALSLKMMSQTTLSKFDLRLGILLPRKFFIYVVMVISLPRWNFVFSYFRSTFGPVEDVRIPSQQKRMFGFVTFFSADTVKMILAKGNPHFVCGARVLVKPYREKSKLIDRYISFQFFHKKHWQVSWVLIIWQDCFFFFSTFA